MKALLFVLALLLAAPLAAQAPSASGADSLVVRPGDALRIGVWPDQSLSGEFRVESSGNVYLPVLGEVRVGGRPIDQIRADLRTRYRAMMANPVVTVTPLFRVSVLGAVLRPGLYPAEPEQTVFDAISQAGGFLPEARFEEVRLIRGGRVTVLNAREALEEGREALSLPLRSGDRIVVPARRRGMSTQTVWSAAQTVAVVVGLYLQLRR